MKAHLLLLREFIALHDGALERADKNWDLGVDVYLALRRTCIRIGVPISPNASRSRFFKNRS